MRRRRYHNNVGRLWRHNGGGARHNIKRINCWRIAAAHRSAHGGEIASRRSSPQTMCWAVSGIEHMNRHRVISVQLNLSDICRVIMPCVCGTRLTPAAVYATRAAFCAPAFWLLRLICSRSAHYRHAAGPYLRAASIVTWTSLRSAFSCFHFAAHARITYRATTRCRWAGQACCG